MNRAEVPASGGKGRKVKCREIGSQGVSDREKEVQEGWLRGKLRIPASIPFNAVFSEFVLKYNKTS